MKIMKAVNRPERNPARAVFCVIAVFLMPVLQAQTEAGFNVSDSTGCTSLQVHFENTGSSGGEYRYHWQFTPDAGDTSNLEDPSFTYHEAGTFEVTQTVTRIATQEYATAQKTITTVLTPPAKLTIDSTYACVNGDIRFNTGYSNKDSIKWIFGDGQEAITKQNFMYYSYTSAGVYNMQCITYYDDLVCSDTSNYTLYVDGPEAELSILPDDACKGAPVEFSLTILNDVTNYSWEFGDGSTEEEVNPVVHSFDTTGNLTVSLFLTGVSGECMIMDTFYIHRVNADFTYSPGCEDEAIVFFNQSEGNDLNVWDFGTGEPNPGINPTFTFAGTGDFPVKLVISDLDGCQDSITKTVTVNALPSIILGDDITICPGVGGTLSVSGTSEYLTARWRPSYGLDDPLSFNPLAVPEVDTVYEVTLTDTVTGCKSTGEVRVSLQDVLEIGYITMSVSADSIVIGDTVSFTYHDELERSLSYSWTPELYLIGCTDCPTPLAQPLESIEYQIEVSDENQCAVSEIFSFPIWVREEYRIGLPDAFTPNGDEINETIRVHGWGIKQVAEFRVYDRNGQLVFFGDHADAEWDGTFNGKPMPVGTYQYYIRAEMWDGREANVQGTFTLLR